MRFPFTRAKQKEPEVAGQLAIFNKSLNVSEFIPILKKNVFPDKIFYQSVVTDDDGVPILDDKGEPTYEMLELSYTEAFIISGRKDRDIVWFAPEGSTKCLSSSEMTHDFFIQGDLTGHTIVTITNYGGVIAGMGQGFSSTKNLLAIVIIAVAALSVGLFLEAIFSPKPAVATTAATNATAAIRMMVGR
jgi:hypothetical protein